ncbi:DUF4124 domain-containing protein [bacterium]|nr:MAG: DUF4124 domain-containing protein [bacterium]
MRTLPLIALAFVAALAAAPAHSQIYKWTDARGQVHYGDQPPSNATQVRGPTPPAATSPPAPSGPVAPPAPTATDITTTDSAAPNPQAASAVRRDVAVARAEQCKKAKADYETAVRAQRIYRTNAKGEREYLSAQEADQQRIAIRAQMDASCGS